MIIPIKEKIKTSADEKVHRIHEINAYENNIRRYEIMINKLSLTTLPNHLRKYKHMSPENIPIDVPLDDVVAVTNDDYKNEMIIRMRCEAIELNKVKRINEALDEELPSNQSDKDTAIAEAITRRTAMMEKANG